MKEKGKRIGMEFLKFLRKVLTVFIGDSGKPKSDDPSTSSAEK